MVRRSCLGLVVGILALVAAGAGRAHIVVEEPWHPAAAAYRTMMFLAALDPVDWELVQEAFDGGNAAAVTNRPAREYFDAFGAGSSEAVDQAIAARDARALYAAMTRAMSGMLRAALADGAASLDEHGTALRRVSDAQAYYRAFADFIRQADPDGARTLGFAWLDLASSLGSGGVMGSGAVEPDAEGFDAARAVIDDYFTANFESERFAARASLTPLPESIVAEKGDIDVTPWLPPGSNLNDQDPLPLLVLNFEKQGIDESDLPLIAYGDMLFDSPEIFGDPARSLGLACSTCHNRSDINQAFFIPGISPQPGAADVDGHFFNSMFNDRRADALDIPSLRGLRFTGPYGRDARFASLADFTRNVIVNEFGGPEPTPFMIDALVAYMLEFDFLPNSKIDGAGMLTGAASEAANRGAEVFRRPFAAFDGKSCASCHVPSANFLDRKAHDIGSGSDTYADARDGAFDTPTLLGTRFTAPYFHDGSLPTLAAVVDWFNDEHELGLTEDERSDLTAYLEAVGDADEPYERFDAEKTPFRLGWEELTTFASTLEALIPRRDAFHARLMIDTVAADLALDASGMANLRAKPEVYRLAGILADVGKEIEAGDWDGAAAEWDRFKTVQAEIDAEMF